MAFDFDMMMSKVRRIQSKLTDIYLPETLMPVNLVRNVRYS